MNQIDNIMQLADLYSVLFGRYRIELSALSLSEHQKARMALRTAIEQSLKDVALSAKHGTPGEPVAWKDLTYGNLHHQDYGNSIPLYTAPQPQREWVDLPPEEIKALANLSGADRERTAVEMAYAVQAKLREKNT